MDRIRFILICALSLGATFVSCPRLALAQKEAHDTINSIKSKPKATVKKSPVTARKTRTVSKPPSRPRRTTTRSAKRPQPAQSAATQPQQLKSATGSKPIAASLVPIAPQPRLLSAMGCSWTIGGGDNISRSDVDQLYVSQTRISAAASPAFANTKIDLGAAQFWRISFDYRFGEIGPSSTGVFVRGAGRPIASVTTGRAIAGVFSYLEGSPSHSATPSDTNWHHIELYGTQNRAALWRDGVRIDDKETAGLPDTIAVGAATPEIAMPTEMWVGNISVSPAPEGGYVDLYNGSDLSGWRISSLSVPWRVQDGTLTNVRGKADDWLDWMGPLPGNGYEVNVRMRIVSGLRFRLLLTPDPISLGNESGFYLGALGESREFKLLGPDVINLKTLANPKYELGEWFEIRIRVSADGGVMMFINEQLCQTARVARKKPLRVTVLAGDGWSEGRIEIGFLRVWMRR